MSSLVEVVHSALQSRTQLDLSSDAAGRSVDAGHLETVTLVDVYIKCLQHPLRTPLLCPISASSRRQSKRVRSCHFRAIVSLARILNL